MTLKVRVSLLSIIEKFQSILTFIPFYRSWKLINEFWMMPTCMTFSRIIIEFHDGLQNQPIVRSLNPGIWMKDVIENQKPVSMDIHNLWKKLDIKTLGISERQEIQIYFKKWLYSLMPILSWHCIFSFGYLYVWQILPWMFLKTVPGIWQSNLVHLIGNLLISFIHKDIITPILLFKILYWNIAN